MSDISNQLIKDSYNYVLQSDLVTGLVYRIGGVIPVNPIFQSGLTVNGSFTYSNGTEQLGYVMTCDAFGNANWAPASAATPSSGVTSITATNGLSGNVTTGAVTIVNTAPDRTVTITGGTNIEITGTYPDFGVNYTGLTTIQGITGITGTSGVSASTTDYLTTIINTAPDRTVTLSGGTNIGVLGTYPDFSISFTGSIPTQGITAITSTNGVSANTINNTTTIINTAPDQTVTISGGTGITTGGTYPNFTIVNSAPDRTVTITGGTNIQITGTYPDFGVNFTGTTTGGTVIGDYLPLSGGTVTGTTQFTGGLTANTISATTYFNLPITGVTSGTGISITSTGGGGYQITNTSPNQTVSITGGTNIQITGTYPNFGVNFTGSTTGGTVSGDYLSLSGGTVTGGTTFQSGLTANTISATTYLNLPVSAVTNGTGISASTSNGTVTITNIAPDQTVTISGGTGITTGGTYPNFTIVNSAPDRTVTLTGGTSIQITGTYPDFGVNYTGTTIVQGITGITGTSGVSASTTNYVTTITNTAPDQTVTISGGTGITTGGTYPNFTLVNSAPDQTVTITGGTNMQIVGTYPNFGVNFTGTTSSNFTGGTVSGATIFTNGLSANTISATTYQNLPQSVSGAGTTNYIPKWTGSTGLGNSQLQDDGSQVYTNQGYVSPLTGNLSINASGTTGIAGRATQYGIYGTISGTTSDAAAVYGEVISGQYGVYGKSIGDPVGTYIGVYGQAIQADSGVAGTTYIGGKFKGDPSTSAGYSLWLEDGTEGVGKVLVSQTSDGKANWNTFSGINITITSAATNTLVFSASTGGGGGGASLGTVYTTANNFNFL